MTMRALREFIGACGRGGVTATSLMGGFELLRRELDQAVLGHWLPCRHPGWVRFQMKPIPAHLKSLCNRAVLHSGLVSRTAHRGWLNHRRRHATQDLAHTYRGGDRLVACLLRPAALGIISCSISATTPEALSSIRRRKKSSST